jgi:hypothetical protein
MLLIDDHTSHITIQMIDYCVSQKIILLYLLIYITHLLQLFDVEIFASLMLWVIPIGWLVGWSIGWLVGWLVNWLVG